MKKLISILPISIILISIYSIIPFPKTIGNIITQLDNVPFWWFVRTVIIILFFYVRKSLLRVDDNKQMLWIKLYLLWNVIEIIHGIFVAENYWDWKGLYNNSMILMMPIFALVSTNIAFTQSILRTYVKYAFPIFFVLIFFISSVSYGFYLSPLILLIFFFPLMPKSARWITLIVSAFIILADLDARSNVIKFAVPIVLTILIPFQNWIGNKFIEFLRKLLFIFPVVIFMLGISGVFNIFKMDEYIKGDYTQIKTSAEGQRIEANLTADTRTFIYEEVLNTAQKYNTWWFGRSPARGNETDAFADWAIENTGRAERLSNEVAIANIFTWTGVVGVVLYFLIFYRASYLAINRSNNFYVKIIGLFIAFRWNYAWIEDINNFSLNYLILWITLGLCYSNQFRSLTNQELQTWVYGIFNKRFKFQLLKFNSVKSSHPVS